MSNNAKYGVAAGAVVLAVVAYLLAGPLVAIGVLVVGALGVAVLLQRQAEEGDDTDAPPRSKKKGKEKLDDYLNREGADEAPPAAPRPRAGGLPTWNPTALDTWTPPSLSDNGAEEQADSGTSQWDSWDNDWDDGSTTATAVEDERNPLDALDRLDDIDPIAEVERIDRISDAEHDDPLAGLDSPDELETYEPDAFDRTSDEVEVEVIEEDEQVDAGSSAFSFSSAPKVIHEEEIKTADDIMAASEATELTVADADGGDSELAKLLAKVQARLSAYE